MTTTNVQILMCHRFWQDVWIFMKYWIFITIILVKPVFVAAMLHSLCDGKSIFAHFPRTIHMRVSGWIVLLLYVIYYRCSSKSQHATNPNRSHILPLNFRLDCAVHQLWCAGKPRDTEIHDFCVRPRCVQQNIAFKLLHQFQNFLFLQFMGSLISITENNNNTIKISTGSKWKHCNNLLTCCLFTGCFFPDPTLLLYFIYQILTARQNMFSGTTSRKNFCFAKQSDIYTVSVFSINKLSTLENSVRINTHCSI